MKPRIHEHVCARCGTYFRSAERRSRYCTLGCFNTRPRQQKAYSCTCCGTAIPPRRYWKRPLEQCGTCRASYVAGRRAAREASRQAPESRQCVLCLKQFTPWKIDSRIACCSKTCRVRYQSRKRKLRLKGLHAPAVIPVAEIYARDRGRCGLCGDRVPITRRYPHPLAATLDHIVPIKLGGRHDRANVQLAHARCNSVKNIRPCGSQLRLLG